MEIKPIYLAAVGAVGVAAILRRGSDSPTASAPTGECPICDESVDPRGLNGHLRFGHDLDPEQARQLTSSGDAMEVSTG